MNEVEKCPLCGSIPKDDENSGDVWCINTTCKLYEFRIPRKFWNYRPIEKSLRDDLAELREEINDTKASYLEMRDKKDNIQNTLDGLKKDIQTVTASYTDMKKKRDILQTELDKYKDFEKKAEDNLKTKLSDMEKAHKYFTDELQGRINTAEETLNILLAYSVKMDTVRLDEYRTIVAGLKKIKGEEKH